jgi:hypothetical protein
MLDLAVVGFLQIARCSCRAQIVRSWLRSRMLDLGEVRSTGNQRSMPDYSMQANIEMQPKTTKSESRRASRSRVPPIKTPVESEVAVVGNC